MREIFVILILCSNQDLKNRNTRDSASDNLLGTVGNAILSKIILQSFKLDSLEFWLFFLMRIIVP